MQMYKVSFHTSFENLNDVGEALICATSAETACASLIALLELPGSRTTCKAERIKPSIWLLNRRDIRPDKKASGRNYGHAREMVDFDLHVSAVISGSDEKHAMRRLAGSLIQKGNSRPAHDAHTKKLMVDCNQVEPEKRALKSMEQVELYKPRSFTGGSPRYAAGKKTGE